MRVLDYRCVVALVGIAILSAGVAVSVAAAQEPTTGHLRGRVLTPTGEPIGQVEVGIATIRAGLEQVAEVVMERGAFELPEINVTARNAKPLEYAWTTKYDDFFRRRLAGFGYFISREEIERKKPWRAHNILAGIPGIRLQFRHPGASGTNVQFTRCPAGGVSVWIDGWKQQPDRGLASFERLSEMLDRVRPSQIEMMEVFHGPAQMPAEFLDNSCAAIAIWAR
jgi:hypothetical protein